MRSILWVLALAAVVSAGIAMTFSPEPSVTKAFAQDSKAPEKP